MPIHNVLEAACKGLKADPTPYDSAAKPELHNRTYVALIIWMTERVRPKLTATADLDAVLEDAKLVADNGKLAKERNLALRKLGYVDPWKDTGAEIVRALAMETMECAINNVCGKGARTTARIAAQLLGAPFLDDLHNEILRLDAVTMIERQELPAKGKVTEVFWRGATGSKTTHVVLKLDTGKYGLIAKTKGRWTWTEGERDEILATLPEAQMEGAVDAVIGDKTQPKRKTTATATATKKKDDDHSATLDVNGVLGAIACADDRGWFATKDGAITMWVGDRDSSSSTQTRVGRVHGMHAAGSMAVTWGAMLSLWRGIEPEQIDTKNHDVESAVVIASRSMVVWAHKEGISFGSKKVATDLVTRPRLFIDEKRNQIVWCSALGVRRYELDGKPVAKFEERLAAGHHSLEPKGDRIALFHDGKREVTIANLETGERELELALDATDIARVVFVTGGDRIMVRYHKGKRVAIFDAKTGKRTHRIQARDVGTKGSAVEDLFPLRRGAILAFAPYPKGETQLLDYDAQLQKRWELKRFYAGGKSFFAESETHTFFAHTNDSTLVLRVG